MIICSFGPVQLRLPGPQPPLLERLSGHGCSVLSVESICQDTLLGRSFAHLDLCTYGYQVLSKRPLLFCSVCCVYLSGHPPWEDSVFPLVFACTLVLCHTIPYPWERPGIGKIGLFFSYLYLPFLLLSWLDNKFNSIQNTR